MSNLFEEFSKSKTLKGVEVLSKTFERPAILMDTGIPALNLAYSGRLDGGIRFGISSIVGRSKSLKTIVGLITAKAYMDYYEDEDAFMIFYDSESGAAQTYFEQVGINAERVIRIPVMDIEELQFDITDKIEKIKERYMDTKKYTRVVFFIDSIGNLASRKEKEDALKKHGATDMGTRAKSLKAMFRVITPYFDNYEMYCVFINHVTSVPGAVPMPDVITGGQGAILACNDVIRMSRTKVVDPKDKKNILGWNFVMNIEKSRDIKEGMKIPFEVTYEDGINKYTGLLDIALVTGHVISPTQGWYSRPSIPDDNKWRKKELMTANFWDPILADETFLKATQELYSLSGNSLLQSKLNDTIENMEAEGE